jgi:hypothetical protein
MKVPQSDILCQQKSFYHFRILTQKENSNSFNFDFIGNGLLKSYCKNTAQAFQTEPARDNEHERGASLIVGVREFLKTYHAGQPGNPADSVCNIHGK